MGPVERSLDYSVAEYGQLALWTGIIGEALGDGKPRTTGRACPHGSNLVVLALENESSCLKLHR